jgi:hypothetical protein
MTLLKRFFATTAIASIAATGALAQVAAPRDATDETAAAESRRGGSLFLQRTDESMLRATQVINAAIYAPDPEYAADERIEGAPWNEDAWDEVGSIADALITRDGDVAAVIVDVGGFLGIGAKPVALSMDALTIYYEDGHDEGSDGGSDDDGRRLTVDLTREQLEDAPSFDVEEMEMRAESGATGAYDDAALRETARRERLDGLSRDGYAVVDEDALSAEEVSSAHVYDLSDETIGSVEELVVGENGSIDFAIVDVGGWLGMGAHTVAVPFDDMRVLERDDDVRVYVDYTRDELERMPEYES